MARTTQIDRANLLDSVNKKASGPGVKMLREVLMDLDDAEESVENLKKAIHKWSTCIGCHDSTLAHTCDFEAARKLAGDPIQ